MDCNPVVHGSYSHSRGLSGVYAGHIQLIWCSEAVFEGVFQALLAATYAALGYTLTHSGISWRSFGIGGASYRLSSRHVHMDRMGIAGLMEILARYHDIRLSLGMVTCFVISA